MITYSIIMTLLTVVTIYIGYRLYVIKGYRDQFYGLEDIYARYRTYFAGLCIALTVTGVVGYVILLAG